MEQDVLFRELSQIHEQMKAFVREKFVFPEAALKLDVESRSEDQHRVFKYLHQQNSMHAKHFVRAQQIKAVYILDGYLSQIAQRNSIGMYLFSRTMLELVAFVYEVQRRLDEIAKGSGKMWDQRGREFFANIVRARYSTCHEEKEHLLIDAGISKRHLKPLNVKSCLESLSKDESYGSLAKRYSEFCDFIHHNLSSQLIASKGIVITDSVLNESGGGIQTAQKGPFTVYEYPADNKANDAKESTLEFMLENAKAMIELINHLPSTPYSKNELVSHTGNIFGMKINSLPSNVANPILDLTGKENIGPNDLCPCGSLKKYKFCCLRRES